MTAHTQKILRRVAYGLLGTLLVIVNVVAGGLIYLSTNSAREKIVALAVKKAQPVFPGGFEIGSSEGSLPRGIVLNDIVIRDLDQRPAVEIERLELRYSLIALLVTRVQVDKVAVEGLTVVSQPLEDGRDNLATLAVINKPLPPVPSALPVSVRLAAVDVDAHFMKLPANGSVDRPPSDTDVHAALHVEADLSHGMVATIDQLKLDVTTPAEATVTMSGGVHITKEPKDMDFKDVFVRVDGDTTQLRRHVDKLELSGPASIVARANGSMKDLVASLSANTTKPAIDVQTAAHVFADRVQLEKLEVTAPFATVSASGTYHFDMTGDGKVHVDASDLRPLALLGAPAMSGSVKLDGTAMHDGEHTRAKVTGAINKFHIATDRIGHVAIEADVNDLSGKATVDGEDIVLGTVDLRTVGVKLDASTKIAHVTASARGAEGIELDVAAEAVPHLVKNRLTAIDATLASLSARAGGTPWKTAAPAHVHADLVEHDYSLDKLDLVNAKQHLLAMGHVKGSAIESASLDLAHFDLSQLAGFIAPGHVLPFTDISAKASAKGPFAQPEVNASFGGTADGRGKRDLIHATTTGEGKLASGRLNAKVFATIGGQKTSAKVDMPLPLRPAQPVDISFDASVLLNPWFADLLVPKLIQSQPILLYSLGATVLVQGNVSGTTSDPKVHLGARLRNWGAENGHGELGASMEYAAKKMSASGTLTFSSLPLGGGSGAGVVEASTVMPVDLAPMLSGTEGTFLDPAAPWHAEVKVKHLGVERVPFAAFAVVPLTTRGWIDGSFELAGSKSHPKGTVKLDARGLNMNGVADIDVVGDALLDGGAMTGQLKASLHGSEALTAKGSIGSEKDTGSWAQAPVAVTFRSNGFDLGRLNLFKNLDGALRGEVELTGTLHRPTLKGEVRASKLRVGSVTYSEASVKGAGNELKGEVEMSANEASGGKLVGRATIDNRKLAGSVTLTAFHFDVESELLPRLREVSAQADGTLELKGTTRAPGLSGKAALTHGELKLATTAVSYRDAQAMLEFDGPTMKLASFKARAGDDGTLEANGSLALRGRLIAKIDGKATLHHFPLRWDTITSNTDATLAFAGARGTRGFETQIKLEKAFVELTDDRGVGGLIGTAHLEDVKVEKARPAPVADPLTTPRLSAAPGHAQLVKISGPVTVRSSGADIATTADLTLDLGSEVPLITGNLALAPKSTVKVFGAPYDVDRGQFTFEHSAQPDLDFSLSKSDKESRIGVNLAGPARQPTAVFWSKPDKLSAVEVASIVTGQGKAKHGVSTKGLEAKVDGPLSEFIKVALSQSTPK